MHPGGDREMRVMRQDLEYLRANLPGCPCDENLFIYKTRLRGWVFIRSTFATTPKFDR
jgi:hypothetical protein